MTALAASSFTSASSAFMVFEKLSTRLADSPLSKLASIAIAILTHIALLGGALIVMDHSSSLQTVIERPVQLTFVTPVTLEPDVRDSLEPVVEPETAVQPAQSTVQPQAEAPEPIAAQPTPQVSTSVEQTVAPTPQILTAEGGQADFAPDAGPSPSQSALRGLLCGGSSEHTRDAAGCGSSPLSGPSAYAAYADAEAVAKVEAAFGPGEQLGYGPSTIDLGNFALPGQVNTHQPHYVSGVHSVFGRLPVQDKVRDPGFGD